MSDWIGANWIWILLGVGAVWFMFRRGGMGCGMGGHGAHGHADPAAKELPSRDAKSSADHEGDGKKSAAAAHGSHRHGGCG